VENTAEMAAVTEITNRDIDEFILYGEFHIEASFAQAALSNYNEELRLRNAGVKYKELGVEERKAAQAPSAVLYSEGKVFSFQNINLSDKNAVPQGSFAHLKLTGVMRAQGGMSTRGIDSLINDLQSAFQNDHISGILLECNTGGGEAIAGTMLQSALTDAPKPVVAYCHQLASAGIAGTLPVDEIIASSNMARFGSIGTLVSVNKKFLEKYKATTSDVYASQSTEKNAAFRAILAGDNAVLQSELDKSNSIFLQEVQTHRNLRGNAATVAHTLSGAMFDAQEAKKRGLIDGVGSTQYALKRLAAHVRLKNNR
jgi:ClpP class serine protease